MSTPNASYIHSSEVAHYTAISEHNHLPSRAACDNCREFYVFPKMIHAHSVGSRKVRCTQERPACARCVKTHVACLYSASKPMGRPKRSRRVSNGRQLSINSQYLDHHSLDSMDYQPSFEQRLQTLWRGNEMSGQQGMENGDIIEPSFMTGVDGFQQYPL